MKKIFVFVCIFLMIASQNSVAAKKIVFAHSNYARILNQNTIFYANPDCTIQSFLLPYGYFVKILQVGVDSTRVSYMDGVGNIPEKIGYIKTADLYFFEEEVLCPYPSLTITIRSDEVLFADSDMLYPKTVLSPGQTATLYGELEILGERFCYVYSRGFIGYVRKSAFENFLLPEHPIPIEVEDPNSSIEEFQSQEQGQNTQLVVDDTLKIIVIVAICIICISIVYLIFRPKNTTLKSAVLCDDDEYF